MSEQPRCPVCHSLIDLTADGSEWVCLSRRCVWRQPVADDAPPASARSCCCLGMIGNTHYMCFRYALDLGHCDGDECPSYAACMKRVAETQSAPQGDLGERLSRGGMAAMEARQNAPSAPTSEFCAPCPFCPPLKEAS